MTVQFSDQPDRRWETPPNTRRWSGYPSPARPLLGYIRVRTDTSQIRIEALRRTMAAFASVEGFVLSRVLVDSSFEHPTAFAELIAAVEAGEAAHVLVPALHHFGHCEGVQLAMKEMLESRNGARALVLFPEHSAAMTVVLPQQRGAVPPPPAARP